MYTPFNSRHFTTHVDPISGAKIAVLSTRMAQIQKGFYFVNSGWSDDGRYLWFFCNFPPAEGGCAAVIDFLTDEIRLFNEVRGSGHMVDHRTGEIYWATKSGIYKRAPHEDCKTTLVAAMPTYIANMRVAEAGTHIKYTSDYKELITDIQTSEGSVIGSFDVVSGAFTEWYRTVPGIKYNHAQVNPVDKDLCMCAHEFTGNTPPALVDGVYPRLQLIGRDGKRTMLKPYKNFGGHEFWAPDGKSIYYQNSRYRDFGSGEVCGCEIGTLLQDMLDGSEPKVICEVNIPGGAGVWHAHCSSDQKYFVMDGAYPTGEFPLFRGCATTVHFYNRETGKLFQFLTKNPIVEGWSLDNQGIYHIDPHPHFCMKDKYITFTTTICGRVDVAIVATEELIQATSE